MQSDETQAIDTFAGSAFAISVLAFDEEAHVVSVTSCPVVPSMLDGEISSSMFPLTLIPAAERDAMSYRMSYVPSSVAAVARVLPLEVLYLLAWVEGICWD